jgi:hypothetical protein
MLKGVFSVREASISLSRYSLFMIAEALSIDGFVAQVFFSV